MKKKPGGDIEGLFRSFGSDGGTYRELAREADAEDAVRRWPMLGEIAPEASERPQELSASCKRHWREHGGTEDESPVPAPQASTEGKRLVGGLGNLLRRGDAVKPAPQDAPLREEGVAVRREEKRPAADNRRLFQRAQPVREERRKDDAPREKRGLFAGAGRSTKDGRAAEGSSLSGVFSRLEGDDRGAKRIGPGRLRKR